MQQFQGLPPGVPVSVTERGVEDREWAHKVEVNSALNIRSNTAILGADSWRVISVVDRKTCAMF